MIIRKFKHWIRSNFMFLRKRNKNQLLIIDDLLPSVISPWRNFEFNELVLAFPNSVVACDLTVFDYYKRGKSYDDNLKDLALNYPALASKCRKLTIFQNANVSLAYTLFYHNIIRYFTHFEKHKMPFVFTLYPGGGFVLENDRVNEQLSRICKSHYFRGVIVNQPYVFNYLCEKDICDENKITLVSGAPINIENYRVEHIDESKFDNPELDILFMANKYMIQGFDKGFDLFQLIAKQLIIQMPKTKFHVIGNFSEGDLIFSELKESFVFHGHLEEMKFGDILSKTQICISPNRINALSQGAFDGFPLASSVTAGLYSNLLVLTDSLNQANKVGLVDGDDFIKISTDVFEIVQVLMDISKDRSRMRFIAMNGQLKLKALYNRDNQIIPRLNFIKKFIS